VWLGYGGCWLPVGLPVIREPAGIQLPGEAEIPRLSSCSPCLGPTCLSPKQPEFRAALLVDPMGTESSAVQLLGDVVGQKIK
jgi:hypothetical protein